MPLGSWSDDSEYPQGAELYSSDLKGGDVRRLTNNRSYDAEATVSPDGKWIVFGRQIDGNVDVWLMKSDGTEQTQLTFTRDWQEGAAYFLPDNETDHLPRLAAERHEGAEAHPEETGQRNQTPMTIYHDEARRLRPASREPSPTT